MSRRILPGRALTRAEISRRYRELHPERARERHRLRYEKDGEKLKAIAKQRYHEDAACREKQLNRHRERKYGISKADFAAMLEKQAGKCASCETPFSQTPHVDHDHSNGAVRGLLCFGCNIAIGVCGEDPEQLRAAAAYIKEQRELRQGAA